MSENTSTQTNRPPRRMGPPQIGAFEKPKDFKGTIKKLLSYMGKYKFALILIFIFAVGSTIFAIIGPKILGNATTELFNGLMSKIKGGKGIDFDKIRNILLWLVGLYSISALLSFLQGILMTGITQKITYKLRRELNEKVDRMPMSFFDKRSNGEIISVITNDVDTLSMGLNQSATQLITSLTSIIGIAVMMFTIDWIMTLAVLLILPISGIFIGFVMKKSQKFFKAQQDYLGHVNGQVEETFGGLNIVQAFNNQENVLEDFESANDSLYKSAWKSQFLSGLMFPVMNFMGNLGYVAIALLGGFFASQGRITVGNIQSFIQYTRNFTQPISQIAQISNMLQSMTAAAERIFEFLEQDEEKQTAEKHAPVKVEDLNGNIEFKNVHFGYNPNKIVINDFSSKVKKGQKIAIVGPTGAGKTTIVKLLMRFYDLEDGAILIDGYDSKDFDRSGLRKMFGMVLQDAWLFSGTIKDNIKYGKLDATDDEVIAAAKAACVHHFVKTLPDGYDMVINEEASNISQGQKQLMTIARSILADPKVLILDEATSSVDTRTELLIQKAMDNLMEGRTSFIIAHRLSTIRDADLILVMNNGDIVEQGKHKQLLKAKGFYASLYNSQFETVNEEAG